MLGTKPFRGTLGVARTKLTDRGSVIDREGSLHRQKYRSYLAKNHVKTNLVLHKCTTTKRKQTASSVSDSDDARRHKRLIR
eukprot:130346-Pyramimonas_sp.AAC.1